MDPMVISGTVQEFNGERYYRCGFYFQRNGRRLHRAVYEYHHGPIPKGRHVHHVNEDRSDNRDTNLALTEQADHLSLHSKGKPHAEAVAAMQDAAKAWHRSDAGRAWHRGHARTMHAVGSIRDVEKHCEWCGQPFLSTRGTASRTRFCHLNCKMAAFRQRHPGYNRRFSGLRGHVLSERA